jgi:sulfate permease, SulP family
MPGGGPSDAGGSRPTNVRPFRRTLRRNAAEGIPGAIGSVPDGMASAAPVGVNPIDGLHASFAGPIGGGLA